jgi:aminoglycoside phosphotransferase (APT) family kinase protein
VRADWLAAEPDTAAHEAAALEVLGETTVRAPRLVAVDADGSDAGAPAVLMTRLSGAIDWNPPELEPFLRRLADALPEIHATKLPPGATIQPYRPYEPHIRRPPPWASDPGVWLRAIEVFEAGGPSSECVFIHRDFYPGNVLWVDGAISGIVDWVNAGVGSPDADVGHCRANLAGRFGLEAADRFLDLHRGVSGRGGYHPYWDISAALGGYDEEDFAAPNPLDERFLASALARL